jgi:anti-sigma regulatory factor (Ser/Thr protein kinase)
MARGHVRAALAQWGLGELADTTEMIASELTANAVNASAALQAAGSVPVIRLCLITEGETLVVECWDQAPGFPLLRQTSELAETGRGLAIIDSLTGGSWGWQPANGHAGKCVWAVIPARGLPASALLP